MSYQVATVTPTIGGTRRHAKTKCSDLFACSRLRYDLKDKSVVTIVQSSGFIAISHMRSYSTHLTS